MDLTLWHVVLELLTALGLFISAGGLLSCAFRRPGIPFLRLLILFAAFMILAGLGLVAGAFIPQPSPSSVQMLLKALAAVFALASGLSLLASLLALPASQTPERPQALPGDELDQFVNAAMHDLKAPLRAINNLSQWIAEDLGPGASPQVQEHLSQIGQQVRRMRRLLDDLLAFSRIDRQQHPLETVHLDALVQGVVETLKPGGPGFRFEVHAQLPPFAATAAPLRQVLTCLVDNAIKHHDRGEGLIRIEAVDRGGEVGITVSDDGPGIAPRHHGRIFQPFQTLKPRDQAEGSGLGLAVVKRILDIHHGSVRVDPRPDHGASFTVLWPKQPGSAP
jgi:signal transduction histidine kinase